MANEAVIVFVGWPFIEIGIQPMMTSTYASFGSHQMYVGTNKIKLQAHSRHLLAEQKIIWLYKYVTHELGGCFRPGGNIQVINCQSNSRVKICGPNL
jgi:hypothetical protein